MNILVTAIGTISATTIVLQLKKNKDLYIIGADINLPEYIATSLDVDEYHQFPSVIDNQGYKDFLLDFCICHDVKMIFPIIDEEVELLSKNKEEFLEQGIKPCVPDYDTLMLCRDKYITFQWVGEKVKEISVPTILLSDFHNELAFPLFMKPRKGRSSIGCSRISNMGELTAIEARLKDDMNQYILQPFCQGSYISADIIRSSKLGYFQIVLREEVLRNKNGAAIAVKIIDNNELEDLCIRVADGLGYDGVLNIEFFYDKAANRYSLIEINPRFPAGTGFTCMAGLDLVNQYYRIMNDFHVEKQAVKTGATFARRYETYET